MKYRLLGILTFLVILALACNLSSKPTVNQPSSNEPSSNEPVEEATQPASEILPTEAEQPSQPESTEVPSRPVGINEGLASLNSYKLTITFNSSGPDAKDSSSITMEMFRDKEIPASFTHYTTYSTSKDSEDPSQGDSSIYRIGYDQCSGSEEDWTWDTIPANQKEMQDLLQDMITFSPLIHNPEFVGEETMNGIPSNHFTFKVSGLGVKSGAEVTANQGEYWLAIDGQYIVKYSLILETRGGPNSEILHEQVLIDVTDINQPVSISFPPECINAKNATPTPEE
jgi:hypothetical protein